MRERRLPGALDMPVVLGPEGLAERSVDVLVEWLHSEREALMRTLERSGAVLFRGFPVYGVAAFQRVLGALSSRLGDYTRGVSERTRLADGVFTSTELPPYLPLPLHCELSYTETWPRQVVFCCETPARWGGETPIADMRRVYAMLDADVRRRFEERGLLMIQNVPERARLLEPKGWPDMFGTHDRDEVERACVAQGIAHGWWPNGTLQLLKHRSATLDHPRTGERCWFNSAITFHDSFSHELWRSHNRVLAVLEGLQERWRRRTRPPEAFRRHCTYGDGTEISLGEIEHVREVHRDAMVAFPWHRGDVMFVDNVLAAHGRLPFRGERRILAAMVPRGSWGDAGSRRGIPGVDAAVTPPRRPM